jgi:hypothetical protein
MAPFPAAPPSVVPSPAAAASVGPDEAPRHSFEQGNSNSNGTVYRPARLARRKPGARLPKDVAADDVPAHTGTDEVLLKRIRTALRALR